MEEPCRQCQRIRRWLIPIGLGLAVIVVVLLAACSSAPPPPADRAAEPPAPRAQVQDAAPPALVLRPLAFSQLKGWTTDRQDEALAAFVRSCAKPMPASQKEAAQRRPAQLGTETADRAQACEAARAVPAGDPARARAFFERAFTPYEGMDSRGTEALVTGYYEPIVLGALQAGGRYRTPLYRPPPELVSIDLGLFRETLAGERLVGRLDKGRVVPMPTRAEIEAGALKDRGLEIAWLADPIDAFFLHIQGSGRLKLDDGRTIGVGYAGKNGHTYTAIGRELVRRGALGADEVSMQTIRAWLKRNPAEAPALMAENASFVFFRLSDGEGPIGSQGVVLTPGRSLAVDPTYLPYGLPVWIETADPLVPASPFTRLAIAQDSGGAIKGPLRFDLFWGAGPQAEAAAGAMKARGRAIVLAPKRAVG
ncbi:Murein transglycosylase [uncultured Defluviicoccus sp.]|uniref:peptidoglycan lytic exotransglycosylase n=1 Tax=metagenome TaxID=256318 RepID=A0A380TJU9_9ZZZZ|nr:Murein transglycosylase [uncultured Defluviicoccus sp.]